MTATHPLVAKAQQCAKTLQTQWKWCAIPAAAGTVLAFGFWLLRPTEWQATQALILRDEAVVGMQRQGRFDSVEARKTAQETILEMARNQQVIVAALKRLASIPETPKPATPGEAAADAEQKPKKISLANWAAAEGASVNQQDKPYVPTSDEISSLRDAIKVAAPRGTELGQTEVIHVSVTGSSREDALARTSAVCAELENRLQALRNSKAGSMSIELDRSVELAQGELAAATARLEKLEKEVGPDLGELRILNDSGSGDSNLRSALNQIKQELRQSQLLHQEYLEYLEFLQLAQKDPQQLLVAPKGTLEVHSSLKRLRDGLVDAQLRTATLLGTMNADHPQVRAAQYAEREVKQNLHAELTTALESTAADLKVSQSRVTSLENQQAEVERRLERLAGLRARYGTLVAEVRHRTEILEKANQELAAARASQAAATTTSLLTCLDAPVADNAPIGPGLFTLLLAGMTGGAAGGCGLIFLSLPQADGTRRRWSDFLPMGRRASDRAAGAGRRADDHGAGRRQEDRAATPQPRVVGGDLVTAGSGDRRGGGQRSDRRIPDVEELLTQQLLEEQVEQLAARQTQRRSTENDASGSSPSAGSAKDRRAAATLNPASPDQLPIRTEASAQPASEPRGDRRRRGTDETRQ